MSRPSEDCSLSQRLGSIRQRPNGLRGRQPKQSRKMRYADGLFVCRRSDDQLVTTHAESDEARRNRDTDLRSERWNFCAALRGPSHMQPIRQKARARHIRMTSHKRRGGDASNSRAGNKRPADTGRLSSMVADISVFRREIAVGLFLLGE